MLFSSKTESLNFRNPYPAYRVEPKALLKKAEQEEASMEEAGEDGTSLGLTTPAELACLSYGFDLCDTAVNILHNLIMPNTNDCPSC